MERQEQFAVAMKLGDAPEQQDYTAVVGVPGEGPVHKPIARHLVLANVQLEATELGPSVRMGWTAGDAAHAEDTAERSIEQLAGESRREEQRLRLRRAVTDGAAVEEHIVRSEAVQEFLATATETTLDALPWDDSPKRQARRSAVVSAAHAEDNPAGQTLAGMSW